MSPSVRTLSPGNGTREHFITVSPQPGKSFPEQVEDVFDQYRSALASLGMDLDSGVYATFYVSDAANQEEVLRDSEGFRAMGEAGMVASVIQQMPGIGKVALLAYHIEPATVVHRAPVQLNGGAVSGTGTMVGNGAYEFYFLKNILSDGNRESGGQTTDILSSLTAFCESRGLSLRDVVRTWFYVHDIDNNYHGMSTARNATFDRHGITVETGFPASTAIEGRSCSAATSVLLDALVVKGLQPGQMARMEATTHMNPTVEYNVTFERGIRMTYGDRRHFFVSGTASISNKGEVVHKGDIVKQTERTLENIDALLGNAGAGLGDMGYAAVYLRDMADRDTVQDLLDKTPLRDVPLHMVHGKVCRPGWLIEIDGIAFKDGGNPEYANF